jgi:hypothetical protein
MNAKMPAITPDRQTKLRMSFDQPVLLGFAGHRGFENVGALLIRFTHRTAFLPSIR